MQIAVVGLGLIGGSIAADLMRQMQVRVLGVESHQDHATIALRRHLVHEVMPLEEAVQRAGMVILAVPVDTIIQLLGGILDTMPDHGVVIDTGSTKENICRAVNGHRRRGRFVAAHPLAGTEYSGPEAALQGLFNRRKNILCEAELSDNDALQAALQLFGALGMHNTIYLDARDHDRHLAYVSHLSHVTSFALSKTVLDTEKDDHRIFDLAGTGFASTVRLAKSHPVTWTAIFSQNRHYVLEALDAYIGQLEEFRTHLTQETDDRLYHYLEQSREINRILE